MREIDRLLSTNDAAKFLGISRQAMKMRAYRGMVRTIRGDRGKYQYKMADLVATIDESVKEVVDIPGDTVILREAAKMLDVSYQTLWNRVIRDGLAPRPIGKVNGKWRLSKTDVLGSHKAPGAKPPKINQPKTEKSKPVHSGKYGIEYVTIEAHCPACSDVRMRQVVKGSSKWIYCPRHEKYRYADLSRKDGNRVSFRDIREY